IKCVLRPVVLDFYIFAPTWSPYWFRGEVSVHKDCQQELRVEGWFDLGNEAMILSDDGEPNLGLTGGYGAVLHVAYVLPIAFVTNYSRPVSHHDNHIGSFWKWHVMEYLVLVLV